MEGKAAYPVLLVTSAFFALGLMLSWASLHSATRILLSVGIVLPMVFAVLLAPVEKRASRLAGIVTATGMSMIYGSLVPGLIEADRASSCLSHIKDISVALTVYSQDYDGRFPNADSWSTSIRETLSWHCRSASSPYNYALNKDLAGRSSDGVTDERRTVLVFECDAYLPNPTGGREWFVTRHYGNGCIGFVDGHAHRESGSGIVWKVDSK